MTNKHTSIDLRPFTREEITDCVNAVGHRNTELDIDEFVESWNKFRNTVQIFDDFILEHRLNKILNDTSLQTE